MISIAMDGDKTADVAVEEAVVLGAATSMVSETGSSEKASSPMEDMFEGFKPVRKKIRRKRKGLNELKIDYCPPPSKGTTAAEEEEPDVTTRKEISGPSFPDGMESWPQGNTDWQEVEQDAIEFFGETHEDQDPRYQLWLQQRAATDAEKKLKELQVEDQTSLDDINKLIDSMMTERKANTQKSYETGRAKYSDDERKELQRLNDIYRSKSEGTVTKIKQAIQTLQHRHQREQVSLLGLFPDERNSRPDESFFEFLQQSALQQHQQFAQQQRIPDHIANGEWQKKAQQLQAKQQRQMQEFGAKGESMKSKLDGDYGREKEKIRKQYEQKRKDIEANLQRVVAKLVSQFEQLRK